MMGIDRRALRVAWTVFLFGLTLTVVWFIRSTIAVFAAAVFFAYILSPVVGLVERFIKRRRGLALAIVYCLLGRAAGSDRISARTRCGRTSD